jgi:CRP/FNR family transcriptional regulator
MNDRYLTGRTQLLDGVPEAAAEQLRSLGKDVNFAQNELVFEPNVAPKDVFFVESGLIRTFRTTGDGEEFTLGYIGVGQVLGESALFSAHPRESYAIAAEPATLRVISRKEFWEVMEACPELGIAVSRQLEERFKDNERRLEGLVFMTVKQRLAHALRRLADDFGRPEDTNATLSRKFTQRELAALIGASRPSVNLALSELEDEGLLRRTGGLLQIDVS